MTRTLTLDLVTLAVQLWQALPAPARAGLTRLRKLAAPEVRLALVGGAVRDALLGKIDAAPDLDVVQQGGDAQALAAGLGQPFVWHPVYGNATLHLPDGPTLDLIRARRERYPVPGGPPEPLPGTLEDDLARRDFSLNTLALELLPGGTTRLLALPGALEDLHARTLRPLHARSLHEDASRLVRAARLAARLGLSAHPDLLAQVPDALAMAPRTPRLDAELRLLLQEPDPGRAARMLHDWGAGDLLPAQATQALGKLGPSDASFPLAAALLLSAVPDPARWSERLSLGERPAALLARAHAERVYPPGSDEARLRDLLGLTPAYVPLQGRDLLALGYPAGPQLGRALARLAEQRRQGRLHSAQEEREAALTWLRGDD